MSCGSINSFLSSLPDFDCVKNKAKNALCSSVTALESIRKDSDAMSKFSIICAIGLDFLNTEVSKTIAISFRSLSTVTDSFQIFSSVSYLITDYKTEDSYLNLAKEVGFAFANLSETLNYFHDLNVIDLTKMSFSTLTGSTRFESINLVNISRIGALVGLTCSVGYSVKKCFKYIARDFNQNGLNQNFGGSRLEKSKVCRESLSLISSITEIAIITVPLIKKQNENVIVASVLLAKITSVAAFLMK